VAVQIYNCHVTGKRVSPSVRSQYSGGQSSAHPLRELLHWTTSDLL